MFKQINSPRALALILAHSLAVAAIRPSMPIPTDPAADLPSIVDQWSPMPTEVPQRFDLVRLFRRQTSEEVCGYLSGKSSLPLTCAPEYCGYNTLLNWWGCCSSQYVTSGSTRVTGCSTYTSCVASSALSACTGACASNPQVTRCSNSAKPYCANYAMFVGSYNFDHWVCASSAFTALASFTASDASVTSPIARTSSTPLHFSPSSTPSISSPTTSTASRSASATPTGSSGGSPAGAIAGGVVGGLAVIAALVLGIFFFLRKSKKDKDTPPEMSSTTAAVTTAPPAPGTAVPYKPPMSPPPPQLSPDPTGAGGYGYAPQQQAAGGAYYYPQGQPVPQQHGAQMPPKQEYYSTSPTSPSSPTATSPGLPMYQQHPPQQHPPQQQGPSAQMERSELA